jgi:four helix bundle protein
MANIEKFEDLEVRQRAREICLSVDNLFAKTKLGSNYALRDQMERSSGAIMDNIAEGFDRDGNKEFHHFLSIAKASASELKSQTNRAFDKKLISETNFNELKELCEIEKNKIGALMAYLRKSEHKGLKFK